MPLHPSESAGAALSPAPAATEPPKPEAAPEPAPQPSAAPEPAFAPVGAESEPAAVGQDLKLAGFETPRLMAELARRGYRITQARQSRTPRPASSRRPSKAAELDEAAARGVMPTKPDVSSHANKQYHKRFDKLAELAAAGDWDAVVGYECKGVNTYAKMVRQYRDRLVAAHKAQEAATEQAPPQSRTPRGRSFRPR